MAAVGETVVAAVAIVAESGSHSGQARVLLQRVVLAHLLFQVGHIRPTSLYM